MKIRTGFVSNSSSSSFVCDVCGEEACGMDISLRDYDMLECLNGHIFCISHIEPEKVKEFKEYQEQDDYSDYEVSEVFCPCCNFKNITRYDAKEYMYKKYNVSENEIKKELKEKFATYKDFSNYLKNKEK